MVSGSLALGIRIASNIRGRLLALKEIERLLSYLEGELRYRHATISEAIYNVSNKSNQPFRKWLTELSISLELQVSNTAMEREFKDFYSIWCESLKFLSESTMLNSKDLGQLYDVGKALGYLDIESQQMNLNLERELIHNHILEMDKDLTSRMKNAIIMSFLGGLMIIIALV